MLATASTCDLVLRLPTRYTSDYETFETQLVLSLKGCAGFGHIEVPEFIHVTAIYQYF